MSRYFNLNFILVLYYISQIVYPFLFYLGLSTLKQPVNLFIYSLLSVISTVILLTNNKKLLLNKSLLLYLSLIIYMLFISIIRNTPSEYIPTFMRYILYFNIFCLTYKYTHKGIFKLLILDNIVKNTLYVAVFFGILEIVTGNVQFLNNSYRLSGNFSNHSTGYSLLLYLITHYLFFRYTRNKLNQYLCLSVISLIFLLLTQSRTLIILTFITYPLSFFLLNDKIQLKFKILFITTLVVGLLSYVVINYFENNRLYTLYEILVLGKIDPSTLTRIEIITDTIAYMSPLDYILGQGLGGFNKYYYEISGELGVAAHNIYLQFMIEGGYSGIIGLTIFQFFVYKKFKIAYRKNPIYRDYITLGFALFLGFEILGFLLNAHYFYQSHILFIIVLAYVLATNDKMTNSKRISETLING